MCSEGVNDEITFVFVKILISFLFFLFMAREICDKMFILELFFVLNGLELFYVWH